MTKVNSPRPKAAPRQRLSVDERRRQLIAMGIGVFTAQPYDAVAIDDIARAAGISKGLLYHYFPTKRDFYVACVREAADRLLEATNPDPSLDPEVRLARAVDAFLDYVEGHGPALVALLRGGVGIDPEVARIVEDSRRTLGDRLAEGTLGVEVDATMRVALRGWIGFVEAASLEWLERQEPDRATLHRLLVSMAGAALLSAGLP